MNRQEFRQYVAENYSVKIDMPWARYPCYEVFRHPDNRKWFALVMDVPKDKLGLKAEGVLDVVNLKCDSFLIGAMLQEPGFFPAYRMSKDAWVSVALDGSVEDERIKILLDMSFEATAVKQKANRK